MLIEKFDQRKIVTTIYYDSDKLQYNIKRFKIETTTLKSHFQFIKEGKDNYLELVSTADEPVLILKSGSGPTAKFEKMKVANLVEVMGWKAVGNKLIDKRAVEMSWEAATEVNKPEQGELFS